MPWGSLTERENANRRTQERQHRVGQSTSYRYGGNRPGVQQDCPAGGRERAAFGRSAGLCCAPTSRPTSRRGFPRNSLFSPRKDFPPERLLNALGSEPRAVRPVDKLLSEGLISEETYYRALARHLGCEYYNGEPPLAGAFDAMRGLRCGVAPLESQRRGSTGGHCAAGAFVARLIEATQSSRFRSGSFALTSPQRFASLVRARRSEELLDVALGRLPASLTARHGMTGLQIAVLGVVATLACVLGVVRFRRLARPSHPPCSG